MLKLQGVKDRFLANATLRHNHIFEQNEQRHKGPVHVLGSWFLSIKYHDAMHKRTSAVIKTFQSFGQSSHRHV